MLMILACHNYSDIQDILWEGKTKEAGQRKFDKLAKLFKKGGLTDENGEMYDSLVFEDEDGDEIYDAV